MSDEPRKRSRFDQVGDSEAPRRSKFDRRSRSPPKGDSEAATRSRSPVAKSVEGGAQKKDPAAAAAEAAARINAQLSQKKAPQHVDVPPIRASVWLQFLEEVSSMSACNTNNFSLRPNRPVSPQAPPNPPPLRPTVAPSMSRSTSKTVTISRTSRSMTCVTATP